jgi:hypothetical protein
MPAIIDSAPSCITNVAGAKPADDSADFIIQAAYEKCAGFMTFGPGSTYGDEGAGAATSYYVLTWIGIAVMVAVLVYWVVWENRRLVTWSAANGMGADGMAADTTTPVPER